MDAELIIMSHISSDLTELRKENKMKKSTKELKEALEVNREKAELKFKINIDKYLKFIRENRIVVMIGNDWQYYCFIGYGATKACAIELTFTEALVIGIDNFLARKEM